MHFLTPGQVPTLVRRIPMLGTEVAVQQWLVLMSWHALALDLAASGGRVPCRATRDGEVLGERSSASPAATSAAQFA